MANLKNVKNRILVSVALFGLIFSAVSPSLTFSAQTSGTSYISVVSSSQTFGSDTVFEDVGFYNVDYDIALGTALHYALSNYRSAGGTFSYLQTKEACTSFFKNFVFSDLTFDFHRLIISINNGGALFALFVPISPYLASLENGQLSNTSVVVCNPSTGQTVHALSPVGDNTISRDPITYISSSNSKPSSNGFSISDHINDCFIVQFNLSNNTYSLYSANFSPSFGMIFEPSSVSRTLILASAPVYYYSSTDGVSFSNIGSQVAIGVPYLNTYPHILSNYFNKEVYVFPTFTPAPTLTPIPTVIPTLSPTPIILPYDSSVDLVSDGSTMGFLDTIQGTFDGLQGLAVLTFFGDLITFIYHESNVFGVLLLFIPLISFIVFLIGRSK